jgi:hypothetical protein
MRKHLVGAVALISLLLPAAPALAGDCYADPVHQYAANGTISSAVFMRTHACMDGSSILLTIPSGASIKVIGYTDGWYNVEYNGGRGWVGQQFVSVSTGSEIKTWSYDEFMSAYPSQNATATPPPTSSDPTLVSRLRGYILLDVQSHGEAWYLNPTDSKRYYMRDGAIAYQMMRSFGLGVTEADYAKIAAGDYTIKNRLRGRIVLRVLAHGEAYYIHPKTLTVHYLKDGPAAYEVMRYNSLGITSADLTKITTSEVPIK